MKSFFLAVVLTVCSLSSMAEEPRELKDSEKKAYKPDATYSEVAGDPERFLSKDSKRVFKVINKGFLTKLPDPHEKILPKQWHMLKVENMNNSVPLVFNSKNEKLRKEISELEIDQLVTVYATVSSKSDRDDSVKKMGTPKYIKCQYLLIDDIETSSASKESPSKKEKSSEQSDSSPAESVRARLLDIQPYKHLGKNVRFEIKFKDIGNAIHPQISKYAEISNDEYFTVLPADTFFLPIIARRDNDECVQKIADTESGSKLTLTGAVKRVGDPSDKSVKPMYYILLGGVSN